ncbi:MAG: GFA family protein [Paracoccaceae bacterium]|nr:GFA family protein [Paracoccaceae bacterium]
MIINGQCLCGAVRFHGTPVPQRGVGVCHCGQCRRWGGGGPFMAVRMEGGVTFDADETLVWYRSSDAGERGFCGKCGSSLFWRALGAGNDVAINVSTLPEDHGQQIFEHIWVDDQPGWYDFADARPRKTAAECLGGD